MQEPKMIGVDYFRPEQRSGQEWMDEIGSAVRSFKELHGAAPEKIFVSYSLIDYITRDYTPKCVETPKNVLGIKIVPYDDDLKRGFFIGYPGFCLEEEVTVTLDQIMYMTKR